MELLSEQSGVKVRVAAPLADEVLVLKAKDVPLSQIMDRLAEVLHAEWEEAEDGYLLSRPKDLQEELERKDHAERAAAIQRYLDEDAKHLASLETAEQRAQAATRSLRQVLIDRNNRIRNEYGSFSPDLDAPADLLLKRMLISIGSDELASIPYYKPVAYSTRSTAAQRPLGPEAAGFIQEYIETETALLGLPDDPSLSDDFIRPWVDRVFGAARKPGGVGKVLVFCWQYRDALHCVSAVYTKDGSVRSIGFRRYRLSRRGSGDGSDEVIKPGGDVSLSALSREFHDLFPHDPNMYLPYQMDPSPKRLSAGLRQSLLNPEQSDPLSFTVTDAVFGVADASDSMLVGCLSDSMLQSVRQSISGSSVSLGSFVNLAENAGDSIERKDGWLVIKPRNPVACERYRLPRDPLGRFTRAIHEAGKIGLRSYSRLYFESGDPVPASALDDHYIWMLVAAGVRPMTGSPLDRWLYYLLGSLSDSQWQLLNRGRVIDVGALSPVQKGFVQDWAASGVSITHRAPGPENEDIPDLMLPGSECIPLGVRSGTPFTVERTQRTAIVNVKRADADATDAIFNWPLDASKIGQIAGDLIHGNAVSGPGDLMSGTYRLGSQEWLKFTIEIRPGIILTRDYRGETTYEADAKPMTYDQLPEAFRLEIGRQIEQRLKDIG
ncbi:MAG: hypothetical protein IH851_05875 [Armatimonadetes bacterium]|nr:hypothetical protein [Armatimonadota bacterium]